MKTKTEHKIHARRFQQLLWIGMSVLLGAGFIAGLYWLLFEQDYHNLGLPFGSLKNWWDGGMGVIHSKSWPDYRHGIRDDGEPALWTMVGATLLGRVKNVRNPHLLPAAALVVAPFILLALIVAGSAGITWLVDFGPLSHISDKFSWQQILLGMILGRVLHFAWAPIGSTIRYHIISRSVVKGTYPLWVTLPLMPPAWREAWWEMSSEESKLTKVVQNRKEKKHRAEHALIPMMILVFLFVAIVGNLAKYGVAHGAHIPVMNP